MTKKQFVALILFIFVGGIFAVSGTGYSDDDSSSDDSSSSSSSDDSSDKKRSGLKFSAKLTGAQENPAVQTRGMGRVEARFDEGFTRVSVRLRVRNLSGDVAAAHFHCQRAGENGPVVFGLISPGPCFINNGRLSCTLTNDDFSGADCVTEIGRPVNNIVALALAMRDGLIYTNVHTNLNPGGEVRGQMLEE